MFQEKDKLMNKNFKKLYGGGGLLKSDIGIYEVVGNYTNILIIIVN